MKKQEKVFLRPTAEIGGKTENKKGKRKNDIRGS
jgi:hypothetical protein